MKNSDMAENDERDLRLADAAARGFPPEQIGRARPGPGRPPLEEAEGLTERLGLTKFEAARLALQQTFDRYGLTLAHARLTTGPVATHDARLWRGRLAAVGGWSLGGAMAGAGAPS